MVDTARANWDYKITAMINKNEGIQVDGDGHHISAMVNASVEKFS